MGQRNSPAIRRVRWFERIQNDCNFGGSDREFMGWTRRERIVSHAADGAYDIDESRRANERRSDKHSRGRGGDDSGGNVRWRDYCRERWEMFGGTDQWRVAQAGHV